MFTLCLSVFIKELRKLREREGELEVYLFDNETGTLLPLRLNRCRRNSICVRVSEEFSQEKKVVVLRGYYEDAA